MSEVENEVKGPKTAKRVSGIAETAVVKLLTEDNPKREESAAYERFKHYFELEDGATVKDAIDAGLTMGDIKYDVIHRYIDVEGAVVEEYEVTPRGERAPKEDDSDDVDADEVEDEDDEGSGF